MVTIDAATLKDNMVTVNADTLMDITNNNLLQKYKEVIHTMQGILDIITNELVHKALEGQYCLNYPLQLDLQKDKVKVNCIKKYYEDRGFKVDLTIINANYSSQFIQSISISWATDQLKHLAKIFR